MDGGEDSNTITWGGTSATTFASVAIELDAPPPIYANVRSNPTPKSRVYTYPRRQVQHKLFPPIPAEEAVFIANPVKTSFRTAVQFRPIPTQSVLRAPLPEEPVPPPPVISDENLAPIIYGYGAM
jgi:hypothetical protein